MTDLDASGWQLIRAPYSSAQLELLRKATTSLGMQADTAVRKSSGAVYAARNVLDLVPEIIELWNTPQLVNAISDILGPEVGLVRALFFDKPPQQTWALPWHKDLLIAVADQTPPRPGYSRPRPRAGILHTEPPLEVLEQMLTARIHLDSMTDDNGPLKVLTGSHETGKILQISGFRSKTIHANAGDTLLMRPLLVHASGRSLPGSTAHRRVLHLEFCGLPELPENVQWHTFHRVHE